MEFCKSFGNMDGMDGSCHYCREESPEMWQKCWDYKRSPNRKELAELAALREETDLQRQSIQNLSCQVAALREALEEIVEELENCYCRDTELTIKAREIINCPDPGEKIRAVIEAAKECVDSHEEFNANRCYNTASNILKADDLLKQALAALKEGD